MNISKFTQKSIEAVQNCEKVAEEFGNQEIDQEHLIYSLVNLEDSLILKLVKTELKIMLVRNLKYKVDRGILVRVLIQHC